jgi:hypothetical protein
MKPIETWQQRQVFNFWQDFRAMYGVSPTFEEAGKGMDPKHPVTKWAVRDTVKELAELGWLVNTGAGKSRCWVPAEEARLWDRWGEVVLVVRRAAQTDPMAAEIMRYVEGNGCRNGHKTPTLAGPPTA